jgi:hypothetical protein
MNVWWFENRGGPCRFSPAGQVDAAAPRILARILTRRQGSLQVKIQGVGPGGWRPVYSGSLQQHHAGRGDHSDG